MTEFSPGARRALQQQIDRNKRRVIGPTQQEADEVNRSKPVAESWFRRAARRMGHGAAAVLGISSAALPHNISQPEEHRIADQSRDSWAQEQHRSILMKEKESEFKGPMSFGVIKGVREKAEKPGEDPEVARARIILERVQALLKEGPVDLLLTPEYSFIMEKHPIRLLKTEDGFEVDSRSDPLQQHILSELQRLAKENRTTIFAGTFSEAVDEEKAPTEHLAKGKRNTLLHINPEGKIVGVKRKTMAPEGSFTIKKGDKEYKVLPLICAEIDFNYEIGSQGIYDADKSKKTGNNVYHNIIPEWIKQGGPYDILIHPQRLGDVNFNTLAEHAQTGQNPKGTSYETPDQHLKWLEDAYTGYYGSYSPFLKADAPIVTADLGIAAVFKESRSPLPKYDSGPSYTRASIP